MKHSTSTVSASLCLLAALSGCYGAPVDSDALGATAQEVRGAARFDGSCSNAQESLIVEAERFGRRVTASPAFAQCIQRAVTGFTYVYPNGSARQIGPYRRCPNDPGTANDTATQQAARLMIPATSLNDFVQGCTATTAGSAVASTTLNYGLDHHNDEGFQWIGPYVTDAANALNTSTACTAGIFPPACRFAYPWPYANMAATAWHEASHTHGFQHGDETNNNCGYAANSGYTMQANAAPYIIQACIEVVANDSARSNACGSGLTYGCPRGQLSLVTSLGATTCQCLDDPKLQSVGLYGGRQLTASAFGTFSVSPATGNVLRRVGTTGSTWTVIGGPGRQFAANDDALYAISADGAHVMRYNGSTWTSIGGASRQLVVGGHKVFSIDPATGNVSRYDNSPNAWTVIGGPGAQFAVASDGRLYALTSNRQAVMRFDEGPFGASWTQVGGPAAQIFTAGATLHALRPDALAVLRLGSAGWEVVVSAPTALQGTFVGADGGRIYGLFSQRLTQYRGASGRTAEVIAEDVNALASTGGRVFLERATLGVYELSRP